MISFEEAREIAKKLKPEADYCNEYTDAYSFACHAEDDMDASMQCVVLKADGRALDAMYYRSMHTGGTRKLFVRTFEL